MQVDHYYGRKLEEVDVGHDEDGDNVLTLHFEGGVKIGGKALAADSMDSEDKDYMLTTGVFSSNSSKLIFQSGKSKKSFTVEIEPMSLWIEDTTYPDAGREYPNNPTERVLSVSETGEEYDEGHRLLKDSEASEGDDSEG